MQNSENKNSENKTVLSPSVSIFNPELKVSDDAWCLSFAKHSYKAINAQIEHGFLVIQAPNKLYRREIIYNHSKPGFAKVLADTRMWESDEEFPSQVSALIWKDENEDQNMGLVAHHTWVITKAQGLQLLEDIKKDVSNPPKFFINGDTSLLKEGRLMEHCKSAVAGATALFPIASIVGFGSASKFVEILEGTRYIVGDPIPPLAAKVGLYLTAAIYSSMLYAGVKETDRLIYDPQHNCATWCVEKLTNLNIPHINQDLDFQCTDLLAYVTGLHISTDQADKDESKKTLRKQITHKVDSFFSFPTIPLPPSEPTQSR